MNEEVLPTDATLSSCVEDGAALVLCANPSAGSLVAHFEELLGETSTSTSLDELSLLYCYKYGVSLKEVLKAAWQSASKAWRQQGA